MAITRRAIADFHCHQRQLSTKHDKLRTRLKGHPLLNRQSVILVSCRLSCPNPIGYPVDQFYSHVSNPRHISRELDDDEFDGISIASTPVAIKDDVVHCGTIRSSHGVFTPLSAR